MVAKWIIRLPLLVIVAVFATRSVALDSAWLYYVVPLLDGSQSLTYVEPTISTTFVIDADECYSFLPGEALLAVSQKKNPETIRVIDLRSNLQLVSTQWNARWKNSCSFSVRRNETRLYLDFHESDDSSIVERFNAFNGDFISVYDLTNTSDYERYYNDLGIIPRETRSDTTRDLPENYLPDRRVFSPINKNLIVAVRCGGTLSDPIMVERGFVCRDRSFIVLFDLASGTEVVELANAPDGQIGQYYPGTFSELYNWSPDGRYIAYVTDLFDPSALRGITIFDTTTKTYLPVTIPEVDDFSIKYEMQWSPQAAHTVALLMSRFGRGKHGRVLTYNIDSNRLQSIDIVGDYGGLEWMPDGQSILVRGQEFDLLHAEFSGKTSLIAQNVEYLLINY